MRVLVAGGAGYIGSHMLKALGENGIDVTIVDNLDKGYRDAVVHGDLVEADLGDIEALNAVFDSSSFDGVMHFASFIEVGESVREPARYYKNNVSNTQNLLDVMVDHGVGNFIFSSSAAVYGEPQYTPIDESHPKKPVNPYGKSKHIVEQMLADYERAYGLKSVSLRYFNAAGADEDGQLGERHNPETHLIPLVLQAASGRRDSISVFGKDYDTPDGTCIRDYIHVQDLCDAHLLALEYLDNRDESAQFNLGNGSGFSVQQVIDCARSVTHREIPTRIEARREGDPAILVADSQKARAELGWNPARSELEHIVETAWRWEQAFFIR